MIPVVLAGEPANFDSVVRQKGLSAICELVGEAPLIKRPGPKRQKAAERREDIPADKFPSYWTDCLPEMRAVYGNLCAFSALYMCKSTGAATVDHMLPKSINWDKVYEWSNYRLACGLINSKKNNLVGIIDPFFVADGWFALEFVAFQVKVGPLGAGNKRSIENTIDDLGLNRKAFCDTRMEYYENYQSGEVSLSYLERKAPFVARELRRQGLLRVGDL